jgi:L-aspartate oxidase
MHKVTRWADTPEGEAPAHPEADDEALQTLRATMSRHVGVVRDRAGLTEALASIEALCGRVRTPQARNALTAAKLIAAAALARRESRGAHFRSDFPEAEPALAARTFSRLSAAEAAAKAAGGAPQPADLAYGVAAGRR